MIKKILFLFILIVCLYPTSFAADPFYTNLLNEGKALYLEGKYDEALEDFKIAEFGLIDEKEFVPELYFYYALAQYKKGALAESKVLLDKMKMALAMNDISTLACPKEIERDIYIMMKAQQYLDLPAAKDFSLEFFNLFYQTRDLIAQKQFQAVEANLRRLEKIAGHDDPRLPFLQGFLAFQQQDYKNCVKRLEKILEHLGEEFREDASFYLAYSMLKRGETARSEQFAQKIKNPDYIHRLMDLMDEIKARQQIDKKKKK